MKSLLSVTLFFISLLMPLTPFAQNQTDQEGRKHGDWRAYDERGNLKFEGQFRSGVPYGEFTYYYKDGSVKAISVFSGNGRIAYTRAFHENGNLMAEGKYLGQKKDSIWNYYSQWDKNLLVSREFYNKTRKDSIWITYFPDGDTAELIRYENDLKQGPWLQFFESGTTKLEAVYEDGDLEGKMTVYFPDGNVNVEGSYHNGMKEGTWLYYTEKGEIRKEEFYANGHLMFSETYIKEETGPLPTDSTMQDNKLQELYQK